MLIGTYLRINYRDLIEVGEASELFTNYRKLYLDIVMIQKQRVQLTNNIAKSYTS